MTPSPLDLLSPSVRTALCGAVLLAGSSLCALADDVVTARSGETVIVYATYSTSEDCLSNGGVQVRIAAQPAHGVASLSRVAYRIPAGRNCAGTVVKVPVVSYRSKPGFRGRDVVRIDAAMDTYINGVGETFLGKSVTVDVK